MRTLMIRLTMLLGLMLSTFLSALALPVGAAQQVSDVAIYTQENGQAAYDACYILVGASEVGCDENSDGKVTFADIPYGTYTVQQTADLGAGRHVADFTITVTGNVNSEGFEGFTATIVGGSSSSSRASGSSDVAIVTTEHGQPAYDACYVIVDHSEVGCDENGDGRITFEDVPIGSHTVRQVADLGPTRYVNDFTINVTGTASGDGWERFSATILGGSGGSSTTSDVAIVTTENGQPAYDACYILVGYGNEGCDENGDGKITFEDVPLDTYTVRQTADLGPGRSVPDFTIQVRGAASSDGWERFNATITNTGASPAGAVDIALITRDPDTGGLLTGACYVLLAYSEEGCDENGDGQVTFDDMPPGTWTVRQTQAPAGYPVINDFPVTIDGTFPNVAVGYLVKQTSEQSLPGTRNVSVVFIDSQTHTKIDPSPICLQFHNVSEAGCDDDLPDGQIDFLDLAVGTHEVTYSNMPSGWQRQARVSIPALTIETGQGPQIIYIGIDTGGGSGSSGGSTSAGSSSRIGSTSGSAGTSTVGLEWRTMVIGCDDPVACYRAKIVVTRDGDPVGSCAITTDPNDTSHVHACAVDVPVGVTVQLQLDETTLSPGYIATENDVSFDTTYVGKRASHDFVFEVAPQDGAQGSAAPSSSASGTGNLTVYFWSPRDNTPHNAGECVELVGATERLCNDDYPDGRIEIVDIPAGTYEVCVTHLTPHFFWGRSHGPASVTITPGSHETIRLDMYLKWEIGEGTLCGFD